MQQGQAPRYGGGGASAPPGAAAPTTRTAILIPFRDGGDGVREQQLETWLSTVLPSAPAGVVVYILEQAVDGRKFNRGALLNAGAVLACQDAGVRRPEAATAPTLLQHDVDLLPSTGMCEAYWRADVREAPQHFGGAWPKYADSPTYVGGVLALSPHQWWRANGMPNTMWGWGGEDDELAWRLGQAGVPPPVRPAVPQGSYTDLETHAGDGTPLPTPPPHASADPATKNMARWEAQQARKAGTSVWQLDGVTAPAWRVVRTGSPAPGVHRVTLALLPGEWWKGAERQGPGPAGAAPGAWAAGGSLPAAYPSCTPAWAAASPYA